MLAEIAAVGAEERIVARSRGWYTAKVIDLTLTATMWTLCCQPIAPRLHHLPDTQILHAPNIKRHKGVA